MVLKYCKVIQIGKKRRTLSNAVFCGRTDGKIHNFKSTGSWRVYVVRGASAIVRIGHRSANRSAEARTNSPPVQSPPPRKKSVLSSIMPSVIT